MIDTKRMQMYVLYYNRLMFNKTKDYECLKIHFNDLNYNMTFFHFYIEISIINVDYFQNPLIMICAVSFVHVCFMILLLMSIRA